MPGKKFPFAVLLLTLLSIGSLRAEDERSRVSIAVGGGLVKPLAPPTLSKYRDAGAFEGRIKYDMGERWALAGDFRGETFVYKKSGIQRLTARPLMLMGIMSLFRTDRLTPYTVMGAGLSRNSRHLNATDVTWNKLTLAAGAGVEITLFPLNSLILEAALRHFSPGPGEKAFQTASVTALLNFYIPDFLVPVRSKKPMDYSPKEEELPPLPAALEEEEPEESAAPKPVKQPEEPPPPPPPPPEDPMVTKAQAELDQVQQDVLSQKIVPIQFEMGETTLSYASLPTLQAVGKILQSYPDLNFVIEARADDTSTEEDRMILSLSRAEVIRAYLLQNFSLPPNRIATNPAPSPWEEKDALKTEEDSTPPPEPLKKLPAVEFKIVR